MSRFIRYRMTEIAREMARDAVDKNMERLLAAWDREIDLAFEALREKAVELDRLKREENAGERRRLAEEAADQAISQSVLHYLEGVAASADATDGAGITLPTGVRTASSLLIGPPIAQIYDLVGEIAAEIHDVDDELLDAQRSAAFALQHGLTPHPGDLASLIEQAGVDKPWSDRFSALGNELDQSASERFKNAQLQGFTGHRRLDALAEHVRLLTGYGPGRLTDLVTRPKSLATAEAASAPPSGRPGSKNMSSRGFAHMLDDLFGKAK